MGIGAGIFLLAAGGVLAFGVQDNFEGVDLTVVGWVLMLAGAVGLALSAAMRGRRRTETVIDSHGLAPAQGVSRQEVREDVT